MKRTFALLLLLMMLLCAASALAAEAFTPPELPADVPLHLYDTVALYRPADEQWEVQFHHVVPAHPQYVVTLSDTTLEVLKVQ